MQGRLTPVAIVTCMLAGAVLVVGSLFAGRSRRLVYNPSDSAPRGFYVVEEPVDVRVGDYVIARLPVATAEVAADRGYLPRSVPVLKQVAAAGGQLVCITGDSVFIDTNAVAKVIAKDARGRPLRAWDQCRRLTEHEVFLLNPTSAASYDSRYFGPLDVSFLRGRATRW